MNITLRIKTYHTFGVRVRLGVNQCITQHNVIIDKTIVQRLSAKLVGSIDGSSAGLKNQV
jgi:hypothetical protein